MVCLLRSPGQSAKFRIAKLTLRYRISLKDGYATAQIPGELPVQKARGTRQLQDLKKLLKGGIQGTASLNSGGVQTNLSPSFLLLRCALLLGLGLHESVLGFEPRSPRIKMPFALAISGPDN